VARNPRVGPDKCQARVVLFLSPDLPRNRSVKREKLMVGAIIGLLIIVAIVLVLLKVAVAGGILGLIAIVLLVLLLLGRL
jgi:hypothetical protein